MNEQPDSASDSGIEDAPKTTQRGLWLACGAEGGLVLIGMLLAWLFRLPLAELVNPPGRQWAAVLVGIVATAPMVVFFWLMLRTNWQPLAKLRQQAEAMVSRLVVGAPRALILLLAVAAGIGEEVLFRGAIQPLLSRWLTPWGGVVATAILFGLAHPMSRAYIVVAGIGGLYLGVLAELTGEVLSAIVAHSLYDVVALWWFARNR